MKYFIICLLTTLTLAGCLTSEKPPFLQSHIEILYEDEINSIGAPSRFPDKMYFVFFETNDDGVSRMLSSSSDRKRVHGDGDIWTAYLFQNGMWQLGPIRTSIEFDAELNDYVETGMIDRSNYIEANHVKFAVLTEKRQTSKLIAITTDIYKFRHNDGIPRYDRNVFHITIDSDGYLKTIPMREFELIDYMLDYDDEGNFYLPELNPVSPLDKLETVKIYVYDPKTKTITHE